LDELKLNTFNFILFSAGVINLFNFFCKLSFDSILENYLIKINLNFPTLCFLIVFAFVLLGLVITLQFLLIAKLSLRFLIFLFS